MTRTHIPSSTVLPLTKMDTKTQEFCVVILAIAAVPLKDVISILHYKPIQGLSLPGLMIPDGAEAMKLNLGFRFCLLHRWIPPGDLLQRLVRHDDRVQLRFVMPT